MSRADLRAAAGVAVCALAIALFGRDFELSTGVAVVGGDRILRGEVPYRDFWTVYAPGSTALVAALFRVFGRELAVVHTASALLAAAASTAYFALLRRAGLSARAAAAGALVFAGAAWTTSPDLHSYVVPRLLLVIGFERALAALAAQRVAPLAHAGIAFGAAALFKHDVAGYAAIATASTVLLAIALRIARLHAIRALAALAAGALALVVPGVAFVAAIGGMAAWNDLIAFPLGDFRIVRGERYPSVLPDFAALRAWLGDPSNPRRIARALQSLHASAGAHVPELAFATFAGTMLGALRMRERMAELATSARGRASLGALMLGTLGLPFFWMAAHVQQNTHVFSMAMLAGVGIAGASGALASLAPSERSRRALRAVLVALAVAQAGAALGPSAVELGRHAQLAPSARVLGVPGTGASRVAAGDFEVVRPIVDFVRANVPPDEPIYVGLARHDAIVIGQMSFYFLADRPISTRYHELHPGVSDREDVQREMIADLERDRVRCVIRWRFGWPDARLDEILAARRRERPELGARVLDEYLDAHFEVVATHGEYDVLWRIGSERPWESRAPRDD